MLRFLLEIQALIVSRDPTKPSQNANNALVGAEFQKPEETAQIECQGRIIVTSGTSEPAVRKWQPAWVDIALSNFRVELISPAPINPELIMSHRRTQNGRQNDADATRTMARTLMHIAPAVRPMGLKS